jgi:hypothetical protein
MPVSPRSISNPRTSSLNCAATRGPQSTGNHLPLDRLSHGSEWGPVAPPVFKTGLLPALREGWVRLPGASANLRSMAGGGPPRVGGPVRALRASVGQAKRTRWPSGASNAWQAAQSSRGLKPPLYVLLSAGFRVCGLSAPRIVERTLQWARIARPAIRRAYA